MKKCLVKDHFKRITWDELFSSFHTILTTENNQNARYERVLSEYNKLPKRESDFLEKNKTV